MNEQKHDQIIRLYGKLSRALPLVCKIASSLNSISPPLQSIEKNNTITIKLPATLRKAWYSLAKTPKLQIKLTSIPNETARLTVKSGTLSLEISSTDSSTKIHENTKTLLTGIEEKFRIHNDDLQRALNLAENTYDTEAKALLESTDAPTNPSP